jgi:hypothetical protein
MTLNELETWHRREAEGLLRSAQAEDRRGFYDAVAIKGAKESPGPSAVAPCSCGSVGVIGKAMTMQAAERRKLIARFDPPLSRMRAAELCEFGAYSSALRGRNLAVAKAGKCMIHLMLETGCEHPEDLLSRVRPRVKGR